MARQTKPLKPLIYVFCEGESEQAYAHFLKKRFQDVTVLEIPKKPGLFEEADVRFRKDVRYRDYAEVTDEIWFFFDVETKDADKWDIRIKIINKLRKLRKNPGIRVRLLMTSGCIEYWLMLHYKLYAPSVQTVAEKERIISDLISTEPSYKKGDREVTAKIAEQYPTAVVNAGKMLKNLLSDGLPGLDDTDERNRWLCENCRTFSNVYEAINYMESLVEKA